MCQLSLAVSCVRRYGWTTDPALIAIDESFRADHLFSTDKFISLSEVDCGEYLASST